MPGMYVHTHWGYNHPYAARTWTLNDWDLYLSGLASLGYDLVMLWPLLDCMPPRPNASDQAFLHKVRHVIDLAHHTYGMRFAITIGANIIGNDASAGYTFEQRPYFVCERKCNPADAADVRLLLEGRRRQLVPLSAADALVMIDSDPGGYIGSTHAEFVALMRAHIELFREFNPSAEMIYWMWVGWENYNQFWAIASQTQPGDPEPRLEFQAGAFAETLALMQEQIPEPWGLYVCGPEHAQITDQLGLTARRLFYPYGAIEGEPTFPLTNYAPQALYERLRPYKALAYPRGIMANAQTHCLQLPHTYLFAHFARGGTPETADLAGFADQVVPGQGEVIAGAWQAIGDDEPERMRQQVGRIRSLIGQAHPAGPSSGLLFGDANRFLIDLAMNLELRAALDDLKTALAQDVDVRPGLSHALAQLRPYQQRLGFADAYYGPVREILNEAARRLGDGGVNKVLADFDNWREPSARNGVVLRLIAALDAALGVGGHDAG